MSVQEAVHRILAMGFEDVTVQYNAEHHGDFAYVFFHPSESLGGLCDGDERSVLRLLDFLETRVRLGQTEVIGKSERR